MLTETISGKCPCCGYDKLLQRYGSMGYYQLDGCPKCGFGYGTNHHDDDTFGVEAWLAYGVHILAVVHAGEELTQEEYDKWLNEIDNLPVDEKRRMIFDWMEKQERCDDVETTVFKYGQEDVDKYMATNPLIF